MCEEFDIEDDESVLYEPDFPTPMGLGPLVRKIPQADGTNMYSSSECSSNASNTSTSTPGDVSPAIPANPSNTSNTSNTSNPDTCNTCNASENTNNFSNNTSNYGMYNAFCRMRNFYETRLGSYSFHIPATLIVYNGLHTRQWAGVEDMEQCLDRLHSRTYCMQKLRNGRLDLIASSSFMSDSPLQCGAATLFGSLLGLHMIPSVGVVPFWLSFALGGVGGAVAHVAEYYYHLQHILHYRDETVPSNLTFTSNAEGQFEIAPIEGANGANGENGVNGGNEQSDPNGQRNTGQSKTKLSAYDFLSGETTLKMFKNANDNLPVPGAMNGLYGLMGFDFMLCLHKMWNKLDWIRKRSVQQKKLHKMKQKDTIWILVHASMLVYMVKLQVGNIMGIKHSGSRFAMDEHARGTTQWTLEPVDRTDSVPYIGFNPSVQRCGSFLGGCVAYAIYYKFMYKKQKGEGKQLSTNVKQGRDVWNSQKKRERNDRKLPSVDEECCTDNGSRYKLEKQT